MFHYKFQEKSRRSVKLWRINFLCCPQGRENIALELAQQVATIRYYSTTALTQHETGMASLYYKFRETKENFRQTPSTFPLKVAFNIEVECKCLFLKTRRRLPVPNGCSSMNHQPGPQYHERRADELTRCERDSIVVDRLSPLTPPSIQRLMGPHSSSFTTALLPVKIGSLNKLVHLNKPPG